MIIGLSNLWIFRCRGVPRRFGRTHNNLRIDGCCFFDTITTFVVCCFYTTFQKMVAIPAETCRIDFVELIRQSNETSFYW